MTRYTAVDISTALDQPTPTVEQQAVIESGPRPLLVVAGAGSGKTETMAARVVWLVANGLVEPDQVLGLTFTRKAAAELSQRIGQRLRALARTGLWTPPTDDGTGAEVLGGTPTVSTYHAYAGRLVREHALRVGIEPEFRMLTEAGAWQLAAEAVSRYDGPMDEVAKAESTVIDAVMSLAGEMAEHVRAPHEVRGTSTPSSRGGRPCPTARAGVRSPASSRRSACCASGGPCCRSCSATSTSRGSGRASTSPTRWRSRPPLADRAGGRDRRALAVPRRAARRVPGHLEAQLSLLHSLFHGGSDPVALTAVGDPNQSIYGWRGASATTLARFPDEFADGGRPGRGAAALDELAQRRAHPRGSERDGGPARRRGTCSRSAPGRAGPGPGTVAVARLDSIADEAAHLADWIAAGWRSPAVGGRPPRPPSCADDGRTSPSSSMRCGPAGCPSRSSVSGACS